MVRVGIISQLGGFSQEECHLLCITVRSINYPAIIGKAFEADAGFVSFTKLPSIRLTLTVEEGVCGSYHFTGGNTNYATNRDGKLVSGGAMQMHCGK